MSGLVSAAGSAPARVRVHLVTGSIGAGKTTYARSLADALGAIRFSIDDWMQRLYGDDAPTPLDPAWVWPRVARCEAQIDRVARAVVDQGLPVVLDLGLQAAAHRQRVADAWTADGITVQLHWLDVPADERWTRVQARNADPARVDALPISRAMFDFFESRWQAPTADDMRRWQGKRNADPRLVTVGAGSCAGQADRVE